MVFGSSSDIMRICTVGSWVCMEGRRCSEYTCFWVARARRRDRELNMLQNGCSPISGTLYLKNKALPANPCSVSMCLLSYGPCFRARSSLRMSQDRINGPSTGNPVLHLSAASTLGQGSLMHAIPMLPLRCGQIQTVKALSKDNPPSFRYSPMTKKPKWWWRTLSCLPYIIPLRRACVYAETAYNLHPFLETFELLTYPIHEVLRKLPCWFKLAKIIVTISCIVRRKEWPHFFKFHVMMGLLFDVLMEVLGIATMRMPQSVYWGKTGMHIWTAIFFAYVFIVLECIRCALAGMYADVPFVSNAAYMYVPYEEGVAL